MKNPTFFRASTAKSAAEKLTRKRELHVPEKGRCLPLSFPIRRSLPRGLFFPAGGTTRAKRRINRELKDVCGSQKRSLSYEKVSFGLNRSCSSPFTAQPERTGALGLLSSLLSWLPLCLLASPLLASRLLVCRVLVSGLLGRLPWPGHGCGGSVLTALISRPLSLFEIVGGVNRRFRDLASTFREYTQAAGQRKTTLNRLRVMPGANACEG